MEIDLVFKEIVRHLKGELVEHLSGYGVFRLLYSIAHRDNAGILSVRVLRVPGRSEKLDIRLVLIGGVEGKEPRVHRGTVDRKGLYRGSGRTPRKLARRAVETSGSLIRADAAREGYDVAGVRILDNYSRLELLSRGGGAVKVFKILIDGIHLVLDIHIYAAVNAETAVVEEEVCVPFGDTPRLHKIVADVSYDGIDVVRIDGNSGVQGLAEGLEVELFGLRGKAGLVVYISELLHLAQNNLLPVFIVLYGNVRAVKRGVVRYANDGTHLRKRKLTYVLAKVEVGCGADAVTPVAEVDPVEISLDDILFIVALLKFDGAEYLLQLSLNGGLVLVRHVFNKLLGYR